MSENYYSPYKCPYCEGVHPFLPHPARPGRLVAYCGERSVCEIKGDSSPVGLVEFQTVGSTVAIDLDEAGFKTVGDLEEAVFTEEGRAKLLSVEGMSRERIAQLEVYFSKDALRIIVTGTGRCATQYYSRRLTSAGLPCHHELIGLGGIAGLRTRAQNNHVIADSSWMAAPYLAYLPESPQVVHLVRHPKLVISSLMRMRFFHKDSPYLRYKEYAMGWMPELKKYRREFDKTAMFYVLWNKMLDKAPQTLYRRHRVEDDDTELLRWLGAKTVDGLYDNKRANHREGKPFSFRRSSLRDDVRETLEEYSESIGYTLTEVP
jgi:hypothetical protein